MVTYEYITFTGETESLSVKAGSDPIPGDDCVRHQIFGIPWGYFVLLGFRVRFELLKQVVSPCPKMYRLLWYEYEYQHGI